MLLTTSITVRPPVNQVSMRHSTHFLQNNFCSAFDQPTDTPDRDPSASSLQAPRHACPPVGTASSPAPHRAHQGPVARGSTPVYAHNYLRRAAGILTLFPQCRLLHVSDGCGFLGCVMFVRDCVVAARANVLTPSTVAAQRSESAPSRLIRRGAAHKR